MRRTKISKKEREERIALWYKNRYHRRNVKKAAELNKIMSSKNVLLIKQMDNKYEVLFKNGQVFKFTFYPDSLFLPDRIIVKEE